MSEGLPRFGLFIGVGHPFRRDDGVGPWLAARLASGGCNAIAHLGDGAALIELFAEAKEILIADATQTDRAPGSINLLDACATVLPTNEFRNSTHEFGLGYAVETARALGRLPEALWVIGIEGQDFGFGEELSAPVKNAVRGLLTELTASCRPHKAER